MKIKWLGHASFLITSESGTKIVTDPYVVRGGLQYGEIEEAADIVTVSHQHGDHNNVAAVRGNPEVIQGIGSQQVKGIDFNGIPSYHDTAGGGQRGTNTIFCFEIDGIRVCHLGDLGHHLGDKEINALGKVDILLIPVGGFYTIDARVATETCQQLLPKVIIPMHYRNDRCPEFPVSGVDDFLEGKSAVNRLDVSEVEFTPEKIPTTSQVTVLQPAL